jgi:hypothetical protein
MFTPRFTKSIAGTAFAAGMLVVAILVGAGTANANAVDDQFALLLARQGISTSPQSAANLAHNICAALGQGTSTGAITRQMVAQNPGMDPQTSVVIIADSVRVYCPQYGHHTGDAG